MGRNACMQRSMRKDSKSISMKRLWSGDWGIQYLIQVGKHKERVDVYKATKSGRRLVVLVDRGRESKHVVAQSDKEAIEKVLW